MPGPVRLSLGRHSQVIEASRYERILAQSNFKSTHQQMPTAIKVLDLHNVTLYGLYGKGASKLLRQPNA